MKNFNFSHVGKFSISTILFLLIFPNLVQAQSWYNTSWLYRKAITIDYTKVGAGPHSNFPVLISITDANLQISALSTGNDILFTSSDGATKLSHEIENYTSSTGTLVAWVEIPSLSSSANTVIYMYYGNSAATNQQNVTGTWDASFKGVYHMNTTFTDATSNANNGTNTGTTAVTGMISGGRGFTPSGGSDYITINGLMGSPTSFTLSAWASLVTADYLGAEIISLGDDAVLRYDEHGTNGTDGVAYNGSSIWTTTASGIDYAGTGWHYVVYTFDNTTHSQKLYVDGVQKASTSSTAAPVYIGGGSNTFIGKHGNGNTNMDFNGNIDEVRVSNASRSVGWVQTEYNNQNSPSTFYSIASQVSLKTFTGTGNFSSAPNWTGGTLPIAGDYLIIDGACTVDNNVGTDNVAYGTLTIGTATGRTLNWVSSGTNRLKVTNVSAGSATSSLNMTNGGILIITGTWTSTNLTFTPGAGTIEIQSGITLPASYATYNNININNSPSTATLGVNTTVNGSLTVSGTLQLAGFSVTSGDLQGAGTIISSSGTPTLTTGSDNASTTFSGVIGPGTIQISKNGSGVLTLSGSNTYSGITTINSGTIKLGNPTALGISTQKFGDQTIINSGAVLDLNGLNYTTAEYLQSNGSGISGGGCILNSSGTTATFAGQIDIYSTSTITTNNPIIFTGCIASSSSGYIKAGSGTMTVTSVNNTWGYPITVSAGTLIVGSTSALGSSSSTPVIVNSGAALDLNGFSNAYVRILTLNGTGISSGGALINSSSTAATYSSAITLGSASSIVGGTGTITTSGTITGAGFGLSLGGTSGGSATGVISGTGTTVTKNDGGTWTLSGANTFTGGTTLNAGQININNATALGAGVLTVNGGTIDNTSAASITLSNNNTQNWKADFTFAGTQSLNMGTGTVTMSASRQITVSANTLTVGGIINQSTYDLTKSGTGTLSFGSQAVTVNNLAIGAGTLTSTSGTLTLYGNFSNNSTFSPSTGTVAFNSSSTGQSVSGTGVNAFYNLSISNTSSTGVQLNTNATTSHVLTINSGSMFTITPAVLMNVAGTITNSAGASGLVVKASPTGGVSGSLIFHNGSGSPVQGTVEMYSLAYWNLTNPVGAKYKWQFFGIPVHSLASTSPIFDGAYVRQLHENDSPSHWEQLNNASGLTSFTGYEITQAAAGTYVFQGQLENSDYSATLPYTSGVSYPGQSLIGNPYTAAINISKIVFGSAMLKTVYIYNSGSYNDWQLVGSGTTSDSINTNITPGQYTAVPQAQAGNAGLQHQIPSMQAFLVRAQSNSVNATINIPYSVASTVVSDSVPQRVSSMHNSTTTSAKVWTRIDVKGSRFSDRMWIFTEPDCTHSFDNGWDSEKFLGSAIAPQLFSMETDGDYQVNSVDDMNNTYLGFQAGEDSIYTLTFTNENLNNKYAELNLLDLQDSTITAISKSGTKYTFVAHSTPEPVKRFKIITTPTIINSVEKPNVGNTELKIFSSESNIIIQNKSNVPGNMVLIDITGRVIQKMPFAANTITTLPTGVPDGIYVVKGRTNQDEVTERLLIKK